MNMMKAKNKWKRKDYEMLLHNESSNKKKKRGKKKGGARRINDTNLALFNYLGKKNRNKKQRNLIIDSMDQRQMNDVSSMINNFLASKYEIPLKMVKRLHKDRKYMYALASSKNNLQNKKSILKQKGGFLQVLAPVAAGLIGSVLEKIF